MIKSLINADEEPPEGTKVIIEDRIISPTNDLSAINETRPVFEIPEDAKFFAKPDETAETINEASPLNETYELPSAQIIETPENPAANEFENQPFAVESDGKTDAEPIEIFTQHESKPPSTAETIRQSGMAYSAAIVFFGSVVFMMILGWLADWLLGTKPWGIVGGIILGGIIGFIQFFRITSQIFKK